MTGAIPITVGINIVSVDCMFVYMHTLTSPTCSFSLIEIPPSVRHNSPWFICHWVEKNAFSSSPIYKFRDRFSILQYSIIIDSSCFEVEIRYWIGNETTTIHDCESSKFTTYSSFTIVWVPAPSQELLWWSTGLTEWWVHIDYTHHWIISLRNPCVCCHNFLSAARYLKYWSICLKLSIFATQRHIVTVFNVKYENFWENLKIHAGGDNKLLIQFASPNLCIL
jgi:hypothetical protein